MMNNNHVGNNIDHYGDGYMEQEEEWEREGLLDPAWEKQQKKTLKNNYIAKLRLCEEGNNDDDLCDFDCSELSLDDSDTSCGSSGSSCLRSKRSLSGFFKGIEMANRLKRSGSKRCCEICDIHACCTSGGDLKLANVKCCPDNNK